MDAFVTLSRHLSRWPALLAVVVVAACSPDAPEQQALACEMGLVDHLDETRAMNNLRVLSVDIGPRVASSPEEDEAARFIARELASYGYDVEIEEFPRTQIVSRLEVHEPAGLVIHAASGRLRDVPSSDYPLVTDEAGVTGRVVDCGTGACPPEVAGAIALLAPGEAESGDRIAQAAEAGASAAILHGEDWRRYTVTVADAAIPFVTVNSEAADALREAGDVELTLHVNRYETSRNVIATRPAADGATGATDAPIVVFSAHFDSVEKSPGASDNGSGTVGLLEIARVLSRVPVGVELRFAAVGAEEGGLVGSRYHVSQLSESEVERIVANFNMDMIGTAGEAQTQLFVNTLDGDNLVARSARTARELLGLPEEILRAPYNRGASDHVSFHDVGIPAANFIWREPETIALEPWYHHPHDLFENVSPDRLRTAMQIVLAASLQVICEEPTPT